MPSWRPPETSDEDAAHNISHHQHQDLPFEPSPKSPIHAEPVQARLLRVIADSIGIEPGAVVDSAILPEEEWLASARELLTDEEGGEEGKLEEAPGAPGAGVDLNQTQL